MESRILVPYDGSDPATAALRFALETFPDATVEVLHFDEARAIAAEYDATVDTTWRYGRPGNEVIEHIQDGAYDHVAMGSHGRSGVERLMLGSVAETTIRRASVPVTVITE